MMRTRPAMPARASFSEAMRPAETTDRWSALETRARTDLALAGTQRITLVEANDEREEALCIAIALREALEEPEKTAALITAGSRPRGAGLRRTRTLGCAQRRFGGNAAGAEPGGAAGAAGC